MADELLIELENAPALFKIRMYKANLSGLKYDCVEWPHCFTFIDLVTYENRSYLTSSQNQK